MTELSLAEREFVSRFGVLFDMLGHTRAYGLMLGWLMICDPPHQSITDLSSTLDISKASVSTGMRVLTRSRVVERHPVSGSRQHYYRVKGNGNWLEIIRERFEFLEIGRHIAETGLNLVEQDPQRRKRIEEYVDFLCFMQEEFQNRLFARWEEYRRARINERESC